MDKFTIEIPELCVVAMVGSTSSGKSSFAAKHFKPTEVLSSDFFRGMVSDDENDQSVSADAFDMLFYAAGKRLSNGKLTVIDATNLQPKARKQVLDLAREQNLHAAAIVIDLPEDILWARNKARADRNLPERVIKQHCREVKHSIKNLKREGFRFIYVIDSLDKLERAEIVRTKMWNDRKAEHGPFDIIGDIHGCCDELELLLDKLGYVKTDGVYAHPENRKVIFLGDFCDRGPRNADTLKLAMSMVNSGNAIAVPGNHDAKLLKYVGGKNIMMTHGIDKTIAEIEAMGDKFKAEAAEFIYGLVSHYVLDDGKLVVAHAGLKQEYIGRSSPRVREFCLYGETTGETDAYGLPVRGDWAADYRGKATVVYGHIAGKEVRVQNNTYCIDTGCVFGGKLTAFRYPEKETVSVAALHKYYEPIKPIAESEPDMGDMLTVGDFNKKLHIATELMPSVDVHENNAAAALEIMSRFAADPHWLIYLPPTMSPCETSGMDGYLEYPLQAFEYYRNNGVKNVVCEKKHMGSRAVVVLCKSEEAASSRFGITDGTRGIIYTRTGRRFFEDMSVEKALLDRLDAVLNKTGFWTEFKTDWVCLDTELMPWSEKAQRLITTQYAPTGNVGEGSLEAAIAALERTCERNNKAFDIDASGQNFDPSELLARYKSKRCDMQSYIKAYREYCWTVNGVDDYRIAPFHILAVEGRVFSRETHVWHMEIIKKYMTGIDPVFVATPYICVNLDDEQSVNAGAKWWLDLTASGGEGMVVKPEVFTAVQGSKLLQPAVQCRGREYLRIIYGPEYLENEHLARLKKRSLGRKRALALREFSLGMESLTRFVNGEPLYRVHECAFGVLAFESEPVDPRL